MVVLAILSKRSMYGYELMSTISDWGNGEFQIKQGTLYPLLYRLEREGWIEADWEEPPQGKKRKVYSLTREGKKVCASRMEEWARHTKAVNSILKECHEGK